MRWFLSSIVAVVVAIGIYVGSAIVSLNGLVAAAKAGNGTEILARTDVPPGRQAVPPQTFAIGDRVRVKNEYVTGHHRMPGYIRGKVGVVVGISPP
jgi:Nitrile hydratase beta subunit, C-terminal